MDRIGNRIDRKGLAKRMAAELPDIRKRLSLLREDLEDKTNIGSRRIAAIEEGRQEMKWSEFLSVVFILWSDEGGRMLLEEKELFPEELKKAMQYKENT